MTPSASRQKTTTGAIILLVWIIITQQLRSLMLYKEKAYTKHQHFDT